MLSSLGISIITRRTAILFSHAYAYMLIHNEDKHKKNKCVRSSNGLTFMYVLMIMLALMPHENQPYVTDGNRRAFVKSQSYNC